MLRTINIIGLALIAAALLAPTAVGLQEKAPPKQEKAPAAKADQKKTAKDEEWKGEPYTLETCAASGRPIDVKGTPQTVFFEGRELKFCCGGCADFVKKKPAKYLAKVDEQLIAQQAPLYPTTKCVVGGRELYKDGKFIGEELMVGNRLFRVCCDKCVTKIKNDPGTYADKLDGMVLEKAKAMKVADNCPVQTGRKLGKSARTFVVAGRPVTVCCARCEKAVRKAPMDYLPEIDETLAKARKEAHKKSKPEAKADGKDGADGKNGKDGSGGKGGKGGKGGDAAKKNG